jgi:alkylhydroperoxidase family enzyme
MSYLEPLPLDEIEDVDLRRLIARCDELGVPDARFGQILAHKPAQAKAALGAIVHSHFEGNVDHRLKEIIRIQLARLAKDAYFASLRSKKALAAGLTEDMIEAGCGDYEDSPLFGDAWKCALAFAEQMVLDAAKVDAAFYDEMKRHFSEAEIMEIGAFIAIHFGVAKATRPLDLGPAARPGR